MKTPPHKPAASSRSPKWRSPRLAQPSTTSSAPADWEAVGRVHGKYFGSIRPAATMVVVAALLNPTWRIEMEMDAVIPIAPDPSP